MISTPSLPPFLFYHIDVGFVESHYGFLSGRSRSSFTHIRLVAIILQFVKLNKRKIPNVILQTVLPHFTLGVYTGVIG